MTRADDDCISRGHRWHNRDRLVSSAHRYHQRIAAAVVNPVTDAEIRFSGGDRSLGRDGAGPSAAVAVAEGRKDKKSETRIYSSAAFTLIEILIVIGIILFLAGLLLAVSGFVQEKGKRSRAEAEIAAMSAALETYKADNGIYPQNADTIALDPTADFDSTPPSAGQTNKYSKASLYLYEQLFGVTSGTRSETPSSKSYLTFQPSMLYPWSRALVVR
ncbi:MAG: hypothetical protein DME86_03645 [Verrucomicrobia bacterium]|nr:MAG: hypothetical protein DME86_03645 [Verrucomicrobiota bacterium]